MSDILSKIEKGLKEIFPEIGRMKITTDMLLGQIPDWDSMSSVNFQGFLEQQFKVSVPQDLLNTETSISEVISFITEPAAMAA